MKPKTEAFIWLLAASVAFALTIGQLLVRDLTGAITELALGFALLANARISGMER